jgi:hypothetical protein
MMNWNDILVFVGYMLLIMIPPLVFWYILMQCMVMVTLIDMFGGFMRFLTSF